MGKREDQETAERLPSMYAAMICAAAALTFAAHFLINETATSPEEADERFLAFSIAIGAAMTGAGVVMLIASVLLTRNRK